MKGAAKVIISIAAAVFLLLAVFLAGRYGWKLSGFNACESAGIESVEVGENAVRMTGFYPGSFPEGFCGYYAKEQDGTLYVGFKFSAVFGFFETGDFDITIPVKGNIRQVVIKTRMNEYPVWDAENGFLPQSEQYGVFIRLEPNDVYQIFMSYSGFSGGTGVTPESGEYIFMDNAIMMAAKDADAPVPFQITVRDADGNLFATGEFSFDAKVQRMYLTVTADGQITEDQ